MFSTLILKNLLRNKLRTLLTVMAVALPLFVFTVARSSVDLVNRFLEESDKNLRVAVHQKLTYTTMLPQRIRGEIESLAPEGYIKAICRTTWFGGRIPDYPMAFPSMGVDRDTFDIVYHDFNIDEEMKQRFLTERRGALLGHMLAKQLNLDLGDRLTLKGTIPPFLEMEFVVVGICEDIPGPWLYFGLDYYDESFREATGTPMGVHNFWLKCNTDEARQWALTEIDAHFANSQHETRTEMESTFVASFAKSGGDWVGLVWTVGQLIVLVAIAAAFNTMSMAFRERVRELATMRALGFSRGHITALVLTEGVLLGIMGGGLAVLPIYTLTNAVDLQMPGMGFPIKIGDATLGLAMAVSAACGLLAGLAPAVSAWRIQTATALRKVV